MSNTDLTVVYFDCGDYSKEEDKMVWKPKGKIRTLAMKTHINDVSCNELVSRISMKLGIDEAKTKLQLSYIPFIFNWEEPVYILEDDEVLGFLSNYKDHCRSVLHVQVVQNEVVQNKDGVVQNEDGVMQNEVEHGVVQNEVHHDVQHDVPHSVQNDCAEDCGSVRENDERPNNEILVLQQREADDMDCLPTTESVFCLGNVEWDDGVDIVLQQEFEKKEVLYDIIQKASHQNCFEFFVEKSCTKRLVLKCREWKNGCKWGLRAYVLKNTSSFSVRRHYKMHSCSRASTSTSKYRRKGTARLIAAILQRDYPGRFDTPKPKSLIGMVQSELGVKVSYSTAWRGRQRAANYVRGSPEESYQMMYSYFYMLEKVNPGTVWSVKVDLQKRFKYCFFALGVSVEGFKAMRQVLIIDATWLKNGEGGVLVVVTSQDGNHHHYPIAFGVLDSENLNSYNWFLNKLKSVIPDKRELVFISDRHPALISEVARVYPIANHGFCTYHLAQNVKANSKNKMKSIVPKFLECAQAYREGEFLTLFAAFKRRYPTVVEYLESKHVPKPEKWARCYFTGDRYNIDTSNPVESINAVLSEARKLAVLPMIDAIVKKLAEWFCNHRASAAELSGTPQKLVPFVDGVLHSLCAEAQTLAVCDLNSFSQQYSVIGRDGHTYVVDLMEKSCTCNHFNIDKYPCVHAIAAAIKARIDLESLCSKYFLVDLWVLAYSQTIYPVPHASEWIVPEQIRALFALPPNYAKRKKRGRRQVKRFPSVGEFARRWRRARTRRRRMYGMGLGYWFQPVRNGRL